METSEKIEFIIPTRDDVSAPQQAIFDNMLKNYGKVPNLYAVFAWADNGLTDYLALQARKTTLSFKEREVINLVVSEINDCDYCRRAHSYHAKNAGVLTAEEILEIRRVNITFNDKFQVLAEFTREATIHRGHVSEAMVTKLYGAGYNDANLVDIVFNIGDKIISNYLHNVTHIANEWPEVPAV